MEGKITQEGKERKAGAKNMPYAREDKQKKTDGKSAEEVVYQLSVSFV